jgi:hypothetical protein
MLKVRLGVRNIHFVHMVVDLSPLALRVAARGEGNLVINCRHGEWDDLIES